MIRFILCEGKTDAILLSYYLEKVKNWEYNKKPKNFKIKFKGINNYFVEPYKRENDELYICAVGGKDNFANFYKENIQKYIYYSENEELEYKLAIVADRDDKSIAEIEEHFNQSLAPYIQNFTDRKWVKNEFDNSFGQKTTLSVLVVIIPNDKQGALENLVMDALSEDGYKKLLIDKSKKFVDSISPDASMFISSERYKLKAKLGVSLAVLYPEKVFSLIDEQLREIPWEDSKVLKECFKELAEI